MSRQCRRQQHQSADRGVGSGLPEEGLLPRGRRDTDERVGDQCRYAGCADRRGRYAGCDVAHERLWRLCVPAACGCAAHAGVHLPRWPSIYVPTAVVPVPAAVWLFGSGIARAFRGRSSASHGRLISISRVLSAERPLMVISHRAYKGRSPVTLTGLSSPLLPAWQAGDTCGSVRSASVRRASIFPRAAVGPWPGPVASVVASRL